MQLNFFEFPAWKENCGTETLQKVLAQSGFEKPMKQREKPEIQNFPSKLYRL